MSQPVLTGQDVDLNRYLLVVRQWLWLLVLSAVVAGGISFIISVSMPKTYTAALTLVVGDDTANLHPSVEDVTVSQRLAGVYAGMVTREPILTATVNSLHLPTAWWELQRRVLVVRTDGSRTGAPADAAEPNGGERRGARAPPRVRPPAVGEDPGQHPGRGVQTRGQAGGAEHRDQRARRARPSRRDQSP